MGPMANMGFEEKVVSSGAAFIGEEGGEVLPKDAGKKNIRWPECRQKRPKGFCVKRKRVQFSWCNTL